MASSEHSDDIIERLKYGGLKVCDTSSLKTRLLTARGNVYDEIPKILLPESLRYINGLYEKHRKLKEQLENEKSVNKKQNLQKKLNNLETLIKKKNNELYSEKVKFCFKNAHEIY
jgi:hypothetical protein